MLFYKYTAGFLAGKGSMDRGGCTVYDTGMGIAALDIVLAIVILILAVRAGLRGIIQEAGGLAAWTLGILFAVSFYSRGGAYIRSKVLADVDLAPEILAFIGLFAIVFLAIKIISSMLGDIIERLGLNVLNNGLGVLFGLFEGIVFAALAIYVISRQPLFDPNVVLEGSLFAKVLGGTVEEAVDMVVVICGVCPFGGAISAPDLPAEPLIGCGGFNRSAHV